MIMVDLNAIGRVEAFLTDALFFEDRRLGEDRIWKGLKQLDAVWKAESAVQAHLARIHFEIEWAKRAETKGEAA